MSLMKKDFQVFMRTLFNGFLIGFVVLNLLSACGSSIILMAGLPEEDANEILAVLLDDGITVNKTVEKNGVTLMVAGSQVARALDVMRAHGLPRERFTGIGTVFQKQGLVSSPLEEKARYIYALSQELGDTLSNLDGVLVARVHVVLPEKGNVNETPTPATAAVFIKHRASMSLDVLQPQIRNLVSNAIPGLMPDRVTVITIASQLPIKTMDVSWKTVFGAHVAPDSVTKIQVIITILIILVMLTILVIAYLVWTFIWLPRKAKNNQTNVNNTPA